MNNAPAILRTLIIYAVCAPVAVFIGYLLANPLDYSTLALYGTLTLVLFSPLLLPLALLVAVVVLEFEREPVFLEGSPPPWLVMTVLSLGISVLQRTLSRQSQFVKVPEITLPLIGFGRGGAGHRQIDRRIWTADVWQRSLWRQEICFHHRRDFKLLRVDGTTNSTPPHEVGAGVVFFGGGQRHHRGALRVAAVRV